MKHKHYDMIVAWAEGKQIQNLNENTGEWQDLIAPPHWLKTFQYRIKPEEKQPVERWLWAIENKQSEEWNISISFYTKDEADLMYGQSGWKYFPLEYTRTEFPE